MGIINTAKKHPFDDVDETRQLKSGTPLVKAMRGAIDKCAGFNLPPALVNLFLNLKGLLQKYVQTLTRGLPEKPMTDQEYQLLAATANTSALLLSMVDSLATRVSSLVPAHLRNGISVDDAKDAISGQLRQQLLLIIDAVARNANRVLRRL